MEKLSIGEKYGKRRQITFRIGLIAEDKLQQVAALFNMKPSEYAKAVLYRDLGIFNESLDRRKRLTKKQYRALEEAEDAMLDSEAETEQDSKPLHGRHSTS